MADKIWNLRIFDDDEGVMNRSVADRTGEVLVVSQFTLYGDTRKGRRPGYSEAARPEGAEPLVDAVVAELRALGAHGRHRPIPGRHGRRARQRRPDHPLDRGVNSPPTAAENGDGEQQHRPRSDDRGEGAALPQGHGLAQDRLLADRGALVDRAVVADDGGEAGGGGLEHPAVVLDGAQAARGDLLGLDDGEPVRRAVGGIQQDLAAVVHGVAGAVVEEDLPRDRDAERTELGVEHGGLGAGADVAPGEFVAEVLEERAKGTNSPKGTRRTLS